MAKYFTDNGIPSFAVTSDTQNRMNLIKQFRRCQFTVTFTVDLFNEGVDFPDLRVLLFRKTNRIKNGIYSTTW